MKARPQATDISKSAMLWLYPGLTTRRRQYTFIAGALAATVVVRLVLEFLFEQRAPTYMLFLAPVMATSVVSGFRPALVCCAASWFIAQFFFVDPGYSFKSSSQDVVFAGVFAAEGVVIAYLGGKVRSGFARVFAREQELAASETRLRVAQEAANIATYEWHPGTGAAFWSENAESLMGMTPGSFRHTYEDSLRVVHPEDRASIDEAAALLLREGKNKLTYRVVDSNGRIRWIEGTATAIRTPGGAIDRVVGVMMDVTERRRSAERALFLSEATAELGLSLDYEAALVNVAQAAVPAFADIAVVYLRSATPNEGRVVAAIHNDSERPELLSQLQELIGQQEGSVLHALVRSGESAFVPVISAEQVLGAALSPEHVEILRVIDPSSLICVPLETHGSKLGSLLFVDRAGRHFDQDDVNVVTELGRRAAFAIENAQLLEQSFEREAEVIRANESLQLVADSGSELSQSLDLNLTLDNLTKLIVPRFADACTISVDEGGTLERFAIAGATLELQRLLEAMPSDPAGDRDITMQARQVLQSGRPIFLPEIPGELLLRLSQLPERAAILESVAPSSMIVMPMTVRGHTIGVMSFLRTADSPHFDREDLSLAGQLSRRTALAADNARLYSEARRANDAKDEFLGMMSHELRTPITVIRGGARVLKARNATLDTDTRQGLLDDIEREAERLSRMLENLLALARAELDREVILEPVLLQRLLPRLLEGQGSNAGRAVNFSSDGELPAVAAEPGYIEHIIRNLVGNAMKYSPPDAPIDVVVSGCSDGATIRVLDRGFGIANDEASRIFERFYRSDRTSRLAGGAGLGLAVCKRLVEAMSGEIWANPREGGGLEVGLRLPAYEEEIDL
ncbi:MAG: ATP-binding protein [bacterium]